MQHTLSLFVVTLTAVSATAQKNEVALTLGGYFPHHVQAQSDTVYVVEGNLARRIFRIPTAALYVEVPIAGSLDSRVSATSILPGQSFSTRNYSALFVSPGFKLKLLPEFPLSPFFAVGGGLAHFSRSESSGSSSTNTGVFDFGGGIDWKLAPFVSLRGEVRDFYSGAPQLIHGLFAKEHQTLATGGIVLRF